MLFIHLNIRVGTQNKYTQTFETWFPVYVVNANCTVQRIYFYFYKWFLRMKKFSNNYVVESEKNTDNSEFKTPDYGVMGKIAGEATV